ncbi:hypothetical protein FSP39_005552 [Pinctada imbricata]|uniref:Leucine-rich repeat-containing protein 69 n=1 Tax=Pinctada imbricata TaxID=66713 RepID=A0AA88XTW3_PINIB|nr:hypothetical protein FSP39_005552 [Pinctada imbricata]
MSFLKTISGFLSKLKAEPKEFNLQNCYEPVLEEYLLSLEVGQIQSLQINSTRVLYLPETVGRLTQLTELDLSRNLLRWLPDEMENLKNLEFLNLSHNKFKLFPKVVTKLSTLKSLDLGMNVITILPSAMLNLKKLTTLNLEGNEIKLPMPGCERRTIQEIFEALTVRVIENGRCNMWSTCKPCYDDGRLKSLVDLCTDCILYNKIDYESRKYVPPVVKTYLTEEDQSCPRSNQLLTNLQKCSVCKKYFSTKHNFIHHACF